MASIHSRDLASPKNSRTDSQSHLENSNTHTPQNPMSLFEAWLQDTKEQIQADGGLTANLTTLGLDGQPSCRILYIREYSLDGFVFYTNYDSRKAKEIAQNPNASLLFFWNTGNTSENIENFVSKRQVRIEGPCRQLSRTQSESYFKGRPRESQIGAHASKQSRALKSRSYLLSRYQSLEQSFAGEAIPCPKNWGGYSLEPRKIEFWESRPFRLHHRIIYKKALQTEAGSSNKEMWHMQLLYP